MAQKLSQWKAPFETSPVKLAKQSPISSVLSLGTIPLAAAGLGGLGNIGSLMTTEEDRTPAERVAQNVAPAMRNIQDIAPAVQRFVPAPIKAKVPQPVPLTERVAAQLQAALPPSPYSLEANPEATAAPVAPMGLPQTPQASTTSIAHPEPAPAFDPTLMNMVNKQTTGTMEGVNAKFDENKSLISDALRARLATMPQGGANPLGALAGSRQAEALLSGLTANNAQQAGANITGMGQALPSLVQAHKEGDELRKKQLETNMLVAGRIKEALDNPMFETEKAHKEAQTKLASAETKAKPLASVMNIQEHQDKLKSERIKNALEVVTKLAPPDEKDTSPQAELYRDAIATLNYKGK